MTEPSGQWRDDPTGRFRSRWHDGADWTEHVVGGDGTVTTSPMTAPAQPAAPPAQQYPQQPQAPQQPWQQPQASQQSWQQPQAPQLSWQQPQAAQQYGQPTWQQPQAAQQYGQPAWGAPAGSTGARYLPGPGIAVGALGLLCLVLSLFALKWGDADESTFLKIGKAARAIPGSADLSTGLSITVLYASWAAFVLFGLAIVLLVLAGVPIPKSAAGNTYARIAGAVIAGLGAVGQVIAMTQYFKGPGSAQFGAWLGLIGWFVVAAGFVLGARRATT